MTSTKNTKQKENRKITSLPRSISREIREYGTKSAWFSIPGHKECPCYFSRHCLLPDVPLLITASSRAEEAFSLSNLMLIFNILGEADTDCPENLWFKIETITLGSVLEIFLLKYLVWLQCF